MAFWKDLQKKAFEVGGKILGSIAKSVGLSIGENLFGGNKSHGGSNQDSAIAIAISSNSSALQSFANAQNNLAIVQQQQNQLQKAKLMLTAIEISQRAELAQKERELKMQLSELWRNLKRELQQNEFQNREILQTKQIQADWEKLKLPTIFSRQELEALAADTEHPLFVCAKLQVTEGCPNYFRTELTAETESQIKTFANSVFKSDVRFYSRFFDNEDIFDTNAAQLQSIIPNVPSVMAFSKMTRRNAFFHYKLWGSRSAEILHGNFDVELPWRELAQQLRDAAGDSLDDDDLYETIGDWLTTFQKIFAVFFIDLYAIVDGIDPFYAMKLDSVNVGLPEDLTDQYIQPLVEILHRLQKERIDAFNEILRRQQDEAEQKRQAELLKQREEEERLAKLKSAKGIDYRELEQLLKAQEWRKADELTAKLMCQVAGREKEGWLDTEHINAFPCEDLRTIDQLWVHYSNSKFGFSVQKKLWLECGGAIGKYDYEVWKKFAAKVGWYHPQNNDWRTYNEFMNDTKNAQNALPASLPMRWEFDGLWGGCFSSLAQRLVNCSR